MPIKLLVTSVGDDGPPDEYVFDQSTVTIGRDGSNLLTLPDPMRVVSKHHAELRDTGTAFHLVDLGSKNFTYLNGSRLASGEPSVVNPGDAFTIGDFELRFYPEEAPSADLDRTVFAASYVNPFVEPAEQLATVLGDLRRVFAGAAGAHRDEALRDALRSAMLGGGDEPARLVAEALGGTPSAVGAAPFAGTGAPPLAPPPPNSPPAHTPPAYPAPEPPPTFDAPVVPPSLAVPPPAYDPVSPPPPSLSPAGLPPLSLPPSDAPAPPAGLPPISLPPSDAPATPPAPGGLPPIALPPSDPPPAYAPPPPPYTPPVAPPAAALPHAPSPPAMPGVAGGRSDKVLGVLAESVTKLVGIPRRFRHEFIGQTMTHTQDVAFLYENAPADLKNLLLDPHATPDELEQRLDAIRDATEETVVHQLAMLDGYKASVQDGAQRLLGEVNPEPIEEEVEASNPMYKVPQLRASAVIERLKETHRELGGEDWSVAERRAFRPAFIKAYLARMSRRHS